MSIDTKSMHVTPAGGNVFADLAFEPKEASALKAESQRIISAKLAIKNNLLTALAGWMETEQLKQIDERRYLASRAHVFPKSSIRRRQISPSTNWWTCWHEQASMFS